MRGRGRSGQVLVESALIFPLVLVLVLGAVDFGRAFSAGIAAANAARQAAAYAAQHQADGSSTGGSCQQLWGATIDVALASGSELGIGCQDIKVVTGTADPYGRTPITLTIKAPFRAFTPIAAALGLTEIRGSATARGEAS